MFNFVNEYKKTVIEEIFDSLQTSDKLIYFGSSFAGANYYNFFKKYDILPDFFCDNDSSKSGNTFMNTKIISFDELSKFDRNIVILITSQYVEDIQKQLQANGFKNIYYIEHLYQFEIKEYFKLEYIKTNLNKLESLYLLLNDEKSKEILVNLIKHRLTGNLKYTEICCDIDLYFENEGFIEKQINNNVVPYNEIYFIEDDILKFSDNEIFIDAGAFIGDTSIAFAKKVNGRFEKIISFEPEKKNYEKLRENIIKEGYEKKIDAINVGLYSKNTELKFSVNTDMLMASGIDEDGLQKIEVVALDDYLKESPITFIKMDLEGAEFEALAGAEKIIKHYKPKLAICIYHKPEDLWELPLYIHKLVPEYKIYIRHYHKHGTFETVCYATL